MIIFVDIIELKRYITDFDYEKGVISFYQREQKINCNLYKTITIINLILISINIGIITFSPFLAEIASFLTILSSKEI